MKIIIDGENFRHQITHNLVAAGVLSKDSRNDFFKFDMVGFIKDILSDESSHQIYYYTTKIKLPSFKIPIKLSEKLNKISLANRQWIAQLVNQNITVIKAGHLKVRESSACVHCSKKTLVLQEKGVDVRVAVDLLQFSSDKQQVALLSSDSDIVPSLQATKKLGREVIYICPADRVNRSLVAQCAKVITFDTKKILKYYKDKV